MKYSAQTFIICAKSSNCNSSAMVWDRFTQIWATTNNLGTIFNNIQLQDGGLMQVCTLWVLYSYYYLIPNEHKKSFSVGKFTSIKKTNSNTRQHLLHTTKLSKYKNIHSVYTNIHKYPTANRVCTLWTEFGSIRGLEASLEIFEFGFNWCDLMPYQSWKLQHIWQFWRCSWSVASQSVGDSHWRIQMNKQCSS